MQPFKTPNHSTTIDSAAPQLKSTTSPLIHEPPYSCVVGFAIRAPEHALRLAAVMYSMDVRGEPSDLPLEYMQRGTKLAEWYIEELLRVKDLALHNSDVALAEDLLDFVRSLDPQTNGSKHIIPRDVMQRGPRSIRHREKLNRAINLLLDTGHLLENEPGTMIIDADRVTRARSRSYFCVEQNA